MVKNMSHSEMEEQIIKVKLENELEELQIMQNDLLLKLVKVTLRLEQCKRQIRELS